MIPVLIIFCLFLLLWVLFSVLKVVFGDDKKANKDIGTSRLKLTVKSIIRFEQLSGKQFTKMDYGIEEDMKMLLYCMSDMLVTYNAYSIALRSKKNAKQQLYDFRKSYEVSAQFQKKGTGEADTSEYYFSDLVNMLIAQGIDPNYLLNDMEICDIEGLVKAVDEKKRQDMQERRLWTYFTVMPHINTKKTKLTPEKMYAFPWEEGRLRIEAEREKSMTQKTMERFAKGEIKFN